MFKNDLLFRLLVIRDLVYFLVMLGGYYYIWTSVLNWI